VIPASLVLGLIALITVTDGWHSPETASFQLTAQYCIESGIASNRTGSGVDKLSSLNAHHDVGNLISFVQALSSPPVP